MKYIRYKWKVYQEVDLNSKTKEELQKLVEELVEVKVENPFVGWWKIPRTNDTPIISNY